MPPSNSLTLIYLIRTLKSTLRFQKPRMPQVRGVKGKAVVNYCEPLAAKEMGEYLGTQPILELAQLDPLNVEVILPVDMFGSIKIGMQAEVKL